MGLRNRAVILLLTFLLVALQLVQTGCIKRTPAVSKIPGVKSKPNVGPPLNDEECSKFAVDLKEALASGNSTAAYKMVDWEAILETSMEGVDAPEQTRNGFIRGFKSAGDRPTGIMDLLIKFMESGASYDLLRVSSKDDERHVLFRLISPNGAVNYYDWILARRPNGGVQAVDLYIFATGERITEKQRRFFLSSVPERGAVTNLPGGDSEFFKNFPKIKKMTQLAKDKEYHKALSAYDQLPVSLKKDKNILLIRLAIAQNVGGQEYYSAIEDFLKNYPDDPCADLLAIDLYISKEDYAKALEYIDRLDRSVGGDPYLNVMRANQLIKNNNWIEARKVIQKAIDEEPALDWVYKVLVEISLHDKKFDETVDLLIILADRFRMQIGDLTNAPDYAEFVRSPQYEKWLKSREKK
jgi:tetratricopeptide (TPR) repeat protein